MLRKHSPTFLFVVFTSWQMMVSVTKHSSLYGYKSTKLITKQICAYAFELYSFVFVRAGNVMRTQFEGPSFQPLPMNLDLSLSAMFKPTSGAIPLNNRMLYCQGIVLTFPPWIWNRMRSSSGDGSFFQSGNMRSPIKIIIWVNELLHVLLLYSNKITGWNISLHLSIEYRQLSKLLLSLQKLSKKLSLHAEAGRRTSNEKSLIGLRLLY